MKKLASVLGGILCFALLLGLLCLPAAAADGKWTDQLTISDGENGKKLVKKDGEQVFVYDKDFPSFDISTSAQLAAIAKLVNETDIDFDGKILAVTESMDLSEHYWVPIGTPDHPFKGVIRGDVKTISGIMLSSDCAVATASARYYGLVGYSEGASVSNLTLDGTITVTGAAGTTDYVGAAIAYAKTGSTKKSEVSNVTSKVNMAASGAGTLKLGGIVGEANGAKLSGCANGGMVKLGSKDVYDGSSGTLTVNGTATASVGGLIGSVSAESVVVGNAGTATRNNAPLSVTADSADVGGIVGSVNGAVLYMTSDSNASGAPDADTEFIWSLGNLIVQATTANVGGFIGSVTDTGKCDLMNAVFTRNLTVSGTDAYVGGILGKQTGTEESTFTNCKYITRLRVANTNDQVLLEEKNKTPTILVSSTGTVYTGGIYGYAEKLVLDTPAVGSHADAEADELPLIQSTGNVGGVGGNTIKDNAFINANPAAITTLTVQGDSENGHVGGVFGESAGIDTLNLTVGKLTVTDTHAGANLGGVVGQGNGDFKNVNVTVGGNLTVTGGDSALAGGVAGGNTVVAHTVTLIASGPVSVTGGASSCVGGLFGSVNGSVTTLTLTANDTLTVTGGANSRLGGLVGEMTGNVTALQMNANAAVTVTGGAGATSGGVIGMQAGNANDVELNAAGQTVTVTATGDNGTLGGVFGSFSGASAKTVSLKAKTLSVTDAGTGCALGGAFGRFTGTAETVAATITDKLTVTAGANGVLGGMAGAFSGTAKDWTVTVSNAGKTAKIAVTGSESGTQLGGVFGTFTGTVTATGASRNNFTADKIEVKDSSGTSSLGGFAGKITGASTLSLTEFAGEVSIDSKNSDTFANTDNRIGTIAGSAENLTLETTELNVASVITAKGNSGALGGLFGAFNGTVDGSTLHVIGSIDLNHTGDGSHIGGFAGENSGTLNNVNLGDRIFLRASEGSQCVIGGLVGVNTAAGKIDFCYTTAELLTEGKSSAFNKLYQSTVGGLVGSNAGTVLNSYRDIEVVMVSSKDDGAVSYVGGLIGSMSGGSVEKCYTSCDVDVSGVTNLGAYAGGLIGRLTGGTVKNCYTAEKTIKANTDYGTVGGFVGEMSGSETRIEQCYTAMHVDAGAYKGVFFGFFKEGTVKSCIRLVDNGKEINYNMEAAGRENLPVDLSEMTAKSTDGLSDAGAISNWTKNGIWRLGTLEGRANPYPELIRTPADNKVTLNYDLRWYTVDPDQNSYTLSDEADLAGLTMLVNGGFMGINNYLPLSFTGKTLTISNPINIQTDQWIPIGTGGTYFDGTLDGNQKIITGLTADGGLFTTLDSNATVKDVWLETLGISITGSGHAGVLARENKGTVTDPIIYVYGAITTNGGSAGGVCGANNGGSISGATVYVDNPITGTLNAGGVAGASSGAITKPTVELNTAITASAAGSHAGGIAGTFPAGETMHDVSVTFGENASIQAVSHAGGVIGKNSGTINGVTFVYTADGNVSIEATGNGSFAGGVAGENDTVAIALTCADIEVKDSVTATKYAGGLAGKSHGSLTFDNLTVNAPILASGEGSYAGGAVGLSESGINGTTLTLGFAVEATNHAGGIAGYCDGAITSASLTVKQPITASGVGSYAGGAVGEVTGNVTVDVLELDGTVEAKSHAGGLAGKCGGKITSKTLTLNKSITASGAGKYAGGIAGQCSDAITCETLTVKQPITASGDGSYAGGAAGEVTGNVTVDVLELDGTVEAKSHAGGLAGKCGGAVTSKSLTVKQLINASGVGSYAGGAAGDVSESVAVDYLVLDGAVTATGHAGGLAGKCGGAVTSKSLTVNQPITASDAGSYAGGAAGDVSENVAVDYLVLDGAVTATGHAGGLAGKCGGAITSKSLTVNQPITASDAGSYAGSAVGEVTGNVTVDVLELDGAVEAKSHAGGLAGKCGGTITSKTLTLNKSITASGDGSFAGGAAGEVIGGVTYTTLTLDAAVTSKAYAGGLAGQCGGAISGGTMTLNGAVSATGANSYAGGVAGKSTGTIGATSLTLNAPISTEGASSYAGGIAGYADGALSGMNVVLAADISATGASTYAGGLAGYCGGSIASSGVILAENSAGVNISGVAYAGGLAGQIKSGANSVSDSVVSGVKVTGSERTGGLVGELLSTANCAAANVVSSDVTVVSAANGPMTFTGGIFGVATGSMTNVEVENLTLSAAQTGAGNVFVGGVAGKAENGLLEKLRISTAALKTESSSADIYAGGLIGSLSSALNTQGVDDATLTGVTLAVNPEAADVGTKNAFVGGLVGLMTNGRVYNSAVTGSETVLGFDQVAVGGILGQAEGVLLVNDRASESQLTVKNAKEYRVGGAAGKAENVTARFAGVVSALPITVEQNANGASYQYLYIGGFAGDLINSAVSESFSAQPVIVLSVYTGTNIYAGGFVGRINGADSTVSACYATESCSIDGSARGYAGGFAGRQEAGTIKESYASGKIIRVSTEYAYSGGFVGDQNAGTIRNCYSVNDSVTAQGVYNSYVGAIAGRQSGTVTTSYGETGSIYTSLGDTPAKTVIIPATEQKLNAGELLTDFDFESADAKWCYIPGLNNGRPVLTALESWDSWPDLDLMRNHQGTVFTVADAVQFGTVVRMMNDQELCTLLGITTPVIVTSIELTNDIVLTGKLWTPINELPANAVLEGGKHTVSGMRGGTPAYEGYGLVKLNSGTIRNLKLSGATVDSGAPAGIVTGTNKGSITGVTVADSNLSGTGKAGGIAGVNEKNAQIASCSITADTTVKGKNVGGIAGENLGTISDSVTNAIVQAVDLSDLSATVGGAVGANAGTLNRLTSGATVEGAIAGGIVGVNRTDGEISDTVRSTASVSGSVAAGGIAGKNLGTVGAADQENGIISEANVFATESSAVAGGIAGLNDGGTMAGLRVEKDAVVKGLTAGGIAGENTGTITASSTSANVQTSNTDNDSSTVGGAVGTNAGALSKITSDATVNGAIAGGVAGVNQTAGTISRDIHSDANVTGSVAAGGVVGKNLGTVGTAEDRFADVFSGADVKAPTSGIIAGINSGTIRNSDIVPAEVPITDSQVAIGRIVGNGSFDKTTCHGGTCAEPVFSPADREFQERVTVSLSTVTKGAMIYYSIGDDVEPTELYTTPLELDRTTTINAITKIDGLYDSEVVTVKFTGVCAPPTFAPEERRFDKSVTVTLTASAEGETIYYSFGKDVPPTELYTEPLVIENTTVINAKTVRNGLDDSEVVTAIYDRRAYEYPAPVVVEPEPIEIPVIVGDENVENVELTAEIEDGIAIIESAELDQALTSEYAGAIAFDVSALEENVEKLVIPAGTIKTLANAAADENSKISGLEIRLSAGTVKLDAAALAEAAKTKKAVTVSVLTSTDGCTSVQLTGSGKPISAMVKIELPEVAEGNVLVQVNPDGRETIIKKSLIEDGKAYALVETGATFKVSSEAKSFPDVTADKWYADAVDFVSSHGLFQGTDKGFEPSLTMNRAMLATVLYRLEGAAATGKNPFDDVPEGTWYTEAVTWANENGIVNGTGDGFQPMANVTREQIATMLYRYAKLLKLDTGTSAALDVFPDGKDTADWAREAMQWAVGVGLFKGNDDGSLNPKGDATRAEVATLMQRMIGLIVK